MQKVSERATVLYDLVDSAYDAEYIKNFSRKLGHVPIIDINKRRSNAVKWFYGTIKCKINKKSQYF